MAIRMKQDRRLAVLGALVKRFVRNGEPVASSQLVNEGGLGCSSATVRNVMAQLTGEGLLHQPHASAGRVPTDEGFRLFVREIVEPAGVGFRDAERIDSEISVAANFHDVLPHGSRLAALFSNSAGVVLAPAPCSERLSRFEFVRLRRNEIVAILVTESGDVRHRLVSSSEDYGAGEIERFNNYLNTILHGLTLPELRDRVEQELGRAQDEYDRLRTSALTLAGQTLSGVVEERASNRLFLDGIRSVLAAPELSGDERRLRAAFEILEERERLAGLLNEVTKSVRREPVALIGSETGIDSFPAALVVAGYGPEGSEPAGLVGVLGTPRMDYERIVLVVGYLAARLSRAAGESGLARPLPVG